MVRWDLHLAGPDVRARAAVALPAGEPQGCDHEQSCGSRMRQESSLVIMQLLFTKGRDGTASIFSTQESLQGGG